MPGRGGADVTVRNGGLAKGEAEVAVIGGGVAGTAIAAFLARDGLATTLLDGSVAGAGGATAGSGAIVRVFDPDPALGALGRRGVELFRNWEALGFAGPAPFRASGFLYIPKPENAEAVLATARALSTPGLPVEAVECRDVAGRFGVGPGRSGPALLEPAAGYGHPRLAAQMLAGELRRRGGTLLESCPVRRIERSGARWRLHLAAGFIEADIVVLAAGAFARRFLPGLRFVVRSIPLVQIHGATVAPLVDEAAETYFCPVSDGLFHAGTRVNMDASDPSELRLDEAGVLSDALERAGQVIGPDRPLSALSLLLGFDGYTPDNRPILGFAEGAARSGLYLAVGLSGRGFKYCLALGEAVAHEIGLAVLGRSRHDEAADLSPFRPEAADIG
jgi:glycine/D-amino acid oxidase-like deaminating enzyme